MSNVEHSPRTRRDQQIEGQMDVWECIEAAEAGVKSVTPHQTTPDRREDVVRQLVARRIGGRHLHEPPAV